MRSNNDINPNKIILFSSSNWGRIRFIEATMQRSLHQRTKKSKKSEDKRKLNLKLNMLIFSTPVEKYPEKRDKF